MNCVITATIKENVLLNFKTAGIVKLDSMYVFQPTLESKVVSLCEEMVSYKSCCDYL